MRVQREGAMMIEMVIKNVETRTKWSLKMLNNVWKGGIICINGKGKMGGKYGTIVDAGTGTLEG